tara:strand:+ start:388 stop:834 length:447 start_codon:yes stop_codon:yes gene_type:complete
MSSKPSHYTKSIASRSKTHYMPYISHLYTSTNSFRPSLYHINAVDLATFNDKDKLKKKQIVILDTRSHAEALDKLKNTHIPRLTRTFKNYSKKRNDKQNKLLDEYFKKNNLTLPKNIKDYTKKFINTINSCIKSSNKNTLQINKLKNL